MKDSVCMDSMLQTIQKYKLIEAGDNIAVAVSGGADSIALLMALFNAKSMLGITLSAVHIEHGIRGEESVADSEFVIRLCRRHDIPLRVFNVDVPRYAKENSVSVELAARELRYSCFKQLNDCKIATAHTASDNLETIIFSIARGTGIKGLAGIPVTRDNIIRPLIETTRKDIELYLEQNGYSYVEDSSNLSDDYTRNAIRHKVIPPLVEIISSAEYNASRMSEILREEVSFLEELTNKAYSDVLEDKKINKLKFNKLNNTLKYKIVIKMLLEHNISYSRERVLMLCELLKEDKAKVSIGKDSFFFVEEDYFYIGEEIKKTTREEVYLKIQKNEITSKASYYLDGEITISLKTIKEIKANSHKNITQLYFDYDKIKGEEIIIRTKKAGDKFAVAGRKGSKSLKKWMNELKIPINLRCDLLIIENDDRIVGVRNLGISNEVIIDERTENVLVISFK